MESSGVGKTKSILKNKSLRKQQQYKKNGNKNNNEDTDSNESQTESEEDVDEFKQNPLSLSHHHTNDQTINKPMEADSEGEAKAIQAMNGNKDAQQNGGQGHYFFVDDAMEQQLQQQNQSSSSQNSSDESSSSSEEQRQNIKKQIQSIRSRYVPMEQHSSDSDDSQIYQLQDQYVQEFFNDDDDQDDYYDEFQPKMPPPPPTNNAILQKKIREITQQCMPMSMPSPFHNQLIPLVKAHRFQQINETYLNNLSKRPDKQFPHKHDKHVSFNQIIVLKTFKKDEQASEILKRQQEKQSINHMQKPPNHKFFMQQQLIQRLMKEREREQREQQVRLNTMKANQMHVSALADSTNNQHDSKNGLIQNTKQEIKVQSNKMQQCPQIDQQEGNANTIEAPNIDLSVEVKEQLQQLSLTSPKAQDFVS